MKKLLCIKCAHRFNDDSNFCPNCGVKIPKIDPPQKKQQSHRPKSHNKSKLILLYFLISLCIMIPVFVILSHYFEYDPEFLNSIKAKWNTKSDHTTSAVIESSYPHAISESDPPDEPDPITESPIVTPPKPPQPEKTVLWKYESEFDHFDSTTYQNCYTISSDKKHLLNIRRRNGKSEVLLSSTYLFRSNAGDHFRVRLKFDDNKPYSNGYNDSSSLGNETIFLKHPQKIINQIEDSESLIIEYPSITNGNLRALFSLHDYNSVCKF